VRGIPHHLIDIRNPNEPYSVAEFMTDAERCIDEIAARGKLSIVVGGTGLYVRALVRGFTIPHVPPNAELRAMLEEQPIEDLVGELQRCDPESLKRIDVHNRRRLVRAIEVCRAIGARATPVRAPAASQRDILMLGIDVPRAELYRRIDERTAQWLRSGLIDEVRRLIARYGSDIAPLGGVVYREVVAALAPCPTIGAPETADVIQALEHRINGSLHAYVRRQMTWFRKEQDIRWVESTHAAEQLVREFLAV
jgi:tRNA dimethylallyltransferase